jgi:hypothetical protein
MWLNLPTSVYVPVAADLIMDSNWHLGRFAQFVGSNGKPLPASSWRRLWTKASWFKRLFGRTCVALTVDRGVDSWIASQRDTHVNRSVSPVDVVDKMILDTYGRTSLASLVKSNPASSFLRTWQDTSPLACEKFSENYPSWAISLRQDFIQRRKSVRRKNGNESSLWRTPKASQGGPDFRSKRTDGGAGNLASQAIQVELSHRHPMQAGKTFRSSCGLQLNHHFVNWLMGWPKIVAVTYDCLGTEWFLWSQRMRSCLYGLVCEDSTVTKAA